jgi:hypothetical protein
VKRLILIIGIMLAAASGPLRSQTQADRLATVIQEGRRTAALADHQRDLPAVVAAVQRDVRDDLAHRAAMGLAGRGAVRHRLVERVRIQRVDVRARVASAMGGNAAWRREALARFGLWDECTPVEDEPSLCYRVARGKRPDEYLVFDPEARMIRRLGVPGGMDKRQLSPYRYGSKLFVFFHDIVGHYFPARFVLLYPAYFVFLAYQVYDWLFDDARGRRSLGGVIAAAIGFGLALPFLWTAWLARWAWRRLRHGAPPHAPSITPTDQTRAALAATT